MSGFEPRSSVNCAITAAKIKLFRHLNVETSLNKDRCCSSVTSHFLCPQEIEKMSTAMGCSSLNWGQFRGRAGG